MFKFLFIEENPAVRDLPVETLATFKIVVRQYMTVMEFDLDYLEPVPGILILDLHQAGMPVMELQEKLCDDGFELPIVMIAGHADVPMAVRAMKSGAFDFLC